MPFSWFPEQRGNSVRATGAFSRGGFCYEEGAGTTTQSWGCGGVPRRENCDLASHGEEERTRSLSHAGRWEKAWELQSQGFVIVPGEYQDQRKLKPNTSRSMTPSYRRNKMIVESLG